MSTVKRRRPQSSDKLEALMGELMQVTHPADAQRRVEICRSALGLVDRQAQPQLWALLQGLLADALTQSAPGSNRIEEAIAAYQAALTVYTRGAFPEEWAAIQTNLGNAYFRRIQGERADNLEQALTCYQRALKVRTRAAFPQEWANLQTNLGATYLLRVRGEPADNLEHAIAHFRRALRVSTRAAFPERWARIQYRLGGIYGERIRGAQDDNRERAITHYRHALEVYTPADFPEQWAEVQHDLGDAYIDRIAGGRAENLERAIACYQRALDVYTLADFPEAWAMTQYDLGNVLTDRILGQRADNLEQAIVCYRQALKVYRRRVFPEEWATTQHNLGLAYASRIRGSRASNLERAIACYERALEVYTHMDFPKEWSQVKTSLADAYLYRIRGERADNLEQAIAHYQQALEVRNRSADSERWALTLHNLGVAYWDRIRGERADNLEQAIAHYQQALEVYTRVAYPEQWAAVEQSLGNVYAGRIRGERADNLEQAIAHYQHALEVHTRAIFPEDWAAIHNNLGIVYADRIREDESENLEQAIAHYQHALAVYTRTAFPERWAQAQLNLGTAYMQRTRGNTADNLEQAIVYYRQALKVYRRAAFPEQWADVQNNLGIAYSNRERGQQAKNLDRAIAYYQRALEVRMRVAFPEQWAQTQASLGDAYALRMTHERAANLEQAIACYQQALEIRSLEHFPSERRRTLRSLGDLYFGEHHWQAANAVYVEAIEAGHALLTTAYTESGRQAEIGETAQVYARDAYCLLRLNQPAAALVRLEQGKARLLAEALSLEDLDLARLPSEQRQAVRDARQSVREIEAEMRMLPGTPARRSDAELGQLLFQARDELSRQLAAIRAGDPELMLAGLNLPDILALSPPGGALVMPVVTRRGSAAFVLPHGSSQVTAAQVVMINAFTQDDLMALLFGESTAPGWLLAYAAWRDGGPLEDWMAAVDDYTRQLWDRLMQPIHAHLAALGLCAGTPVTLLPQGLLSLLPLHAAWRPIDGRARTFLDDHIVSYAPSAVALRASRHRLREARRHARTLLAIINPTADLDFAPIEGDVVTAPFDPNARYILTGGAARVAEVLARAPETNYLHFACHGLYDWRDVMRSGLVLAGGDPLVLAEILSPDVDLGSAQLVTLSACETGLIEMRRTPDEYIGLPAALLQAGAPAVVSSLWAVNDFSTALLMGEFYRRHLSEGQTIAQALRGAQLWLLDLRCDEIVVRLTSARDMAHAQARAGEPNARALWARLDKRREDLLEDYAPDARPFAHPHYWAAFTAVGAA